ncbi:hypothetical protein [Lysobacter gummosus]
MPERTIDRCPLNGRHRQSGACYVMATSKFASAIREETHGFSCR